MRTAFSVCNKDKRTTAGEVNLKRFVATIFCSFGSLLNKIFIAFGAKIARKIADGNANSNVKLIVLSAF